MSDLYDKLDTAYGIFTDFSHNKYIILGVKCQFLQAKINYQEYDKSNEECPETHQSLDKALQKVVFSLKAF